jgi:hypothetical protein
MGVTMLGLDRPRDFLLVSRPRPGPYASTTQALADSLTGHAELVRDLLQAHLLTKPQPLQLRRLRKYPARTHVISRRRSARLHPCSAPYNEVGWVTSRGTTAQQVKLNV